MKIIYKSILMLMILIIASSCVQEEMIEPDPSFILSFERNGQANALAGVNFYVIPTGAGEFFTLFDGIPGREWGQDGAKGIDFNKADSMAVQYTSAGKYKLTLVTTSSGNFGKDFARTFKTVEVNVIDQRNSFNAFNINGVDGSFGLNNEILFSVPDIVTDFKFSPLFGFDSSDAKAYVNGVEQITGVTVNDFSKPVVYTVKSQQGSEKKYTVKFITFPASSEKAITKFSLGLGGNDEVAVIDEAAKTINLTVNYATNVAAVRLVLSSSYGSSVFITNTVYSDRRNYNLSATGIKELKVVAQNGSEVTYKINVVLDRPVNKFTFAGLVPAPEGIIDVAAKTIKIDVLKGTDITKLVAVWTGSIGKVTIGTVTQTNGVTVNDFTSPVTYTFYKGTTAGDKYIVTVNVK